MWMTPFFNGRSLDVFITKLRRYLKDDPQIRIINVRWNWMSVDYLNINF